MNTKKYVVLLGFVLFGVIGVLPAFSDYENEESDYYANPLNDEEDDAQEGMVDPIQRYRPQARSERAPNPYPGSREYQNNPQNNPYSSYPQESGPEEHMDALSPDQQELPPSYRGLGGGNDAKFQRAVIERRNQGRSSAEPQVRPSDVPLYQPHLPIAPAPSQKSLESIEAVQELINNLMEGDKKKLCGPFGICGKRQGRACGLAKNILSICSTMCGTKAASCLRAGGARYQLTAPDGSTFVYAAKPEKNRQAKTIEKHLTEQLEKGRAVIGVEKENLFNAFCSEPSIAMIEQEGDKEKIQPACSTFMGIVTETPSTAPVAEEPVEEEAPPSSEAAEEPEKEEVPAESEITIVEDKEGGPAPSAATPSSEEDDAAGGDDDAPSSDDATGGDDDAGGDDATGGDDDAASGDDATVADDDAAGSDDASSDDDAAGSDGDTAGDDDAAGGDDVAGGDDASSDDDADGSDDDTAGDDAAVEEEEVAEKDMDWGDSAIGEDVVVTE